MKESDIPVVGYLMGPVRMPRLAVFALLVPLQDMVTRYLGFTEWTWQRVAIDMGVFVAIFFAVSFYNHFWLGKKFTF